MNQLYNSDSFLSELRRLGADTMVNHYLLEGVPAFFADRWEDYCIFKENIAQSFGTHPKTVMLVGSGRWGFSTSPDKFPQKFDGGKKRSDLDVAIADPALFDRAWRELYDVEMAEDPKISLGYIQRRRVMLYEGRLDPTTFPPSMRFCQDCERFFKSLSEKSWDSRPPRKIGAWFFRDWLSVQRYYRKAFRQILKEHLQ